MGEVTKLKLIGEPEAGVKITRENKDFWLNALWARKDEIATMIDDWSSFNDLEALDETCEELVRVCSRIMELEKL